MEIAQDDPEEPLGDSQGNKDPHDYIVVNFVERLGPVSQEVDHSFRLIRIVSLFQNKVNYGDQGMRAGGSWNCILARIIVLCDVVQESFDTISAFEKKPFKGLVEEFSEREISKISI